MNHVALLGRLLWKVLVGVLPEVFVNLPSTDLIDELVDYGNEIVVPVVAAESVQIDDFASESEPVLD